MKQRSRGGSKGRGLWVAGKEKESGNYGGTRVGSNKRGEWE